MIRMRSVGVLLLFVVLGNAGLTPGNARGPMKLSLNVEQPQIDHNEKFNPETDVVFHLFTRSNPLWSQILEVGNSTNLYMSSYDANKRTFMLVHGWLGSIQDNFNYLLVTSLLRTGDFNIISVDWSVAALTPNYLEAVEQTVPTARQASEMLNWLSRATDATPNDTTIIGHSLGAHMAGMTARYFEGDIFYLVALDPALPGWIIHQEALRSTDALYTEVMHTMGGVQGLLTPQGLIDFYPSGGIAMPGCENSPDEGCSHHMAVSYYAESIISGGFTATGCDGYVQAIYGNCNGDRVNMGGIWPKFGRTGSYYLPLRASPPYSLG